MNSHPVCRRTCAFALLFTTSLVGPAVAQLFAPFVTHAQTISIERMAAADLDNDGDDDLVATSQNQSFVWIIWNTWPGPFFLGPALPLPGNALDVAAADLDGDGDRDIIALTATQIVVLTNEATSITMAAYALTAPATRIRAVDVDGDGDIDIEALSSEWLLNDGTATFNQRVLLPSPLPSPLFVEPHLTTADIDNDGDLDVVVVRRDQTTFSPSTIHIDLYINTTGIAFSGSTTSSSFSIPNFGVLRGVVSADLDDDGFADLIAFTSASDNQLAYVLFGDGSANFLSPQGGLGIGDCGLDEYLNPLTDFNGDGCEDLLFSTGSFCNYGLSIILGDASRNVTVLASQEELQFLANSTIGLRSLIPLEIDGDGHPDFVYSTGAIRTHQNLGPGNMNALSSRIVKIESGDGQVAASGGVFPDPLVVSAIDYLSHPITGSVTFNSSQASLAPTLAPLINGHASSTATAGLATGPCNVTVALNGFGSHTPANFVLQIVSTPFLETCGAGSQIDATGAPHDSLTINGQTGSAARRIDVPMNAAFTIALSQPPTNPLPAPFVIYGLIGVPSPTDSVTLPFNLGSMCFTPFTANPNLPGAFILANSYYPSDPDALLPSTTAPWSYTKVTGIHFPFQFTLQGLISQDPATVRVTNGVILNIQ